MRPAGPVEIINIRSPQNSSVTVLQPHPIFMIASLLFATVHGATGRLSRLAYAQNFKISPSSWCFVPPPSAIHYLTHAIKPSVVCAHGVSPPRDDPWLFEVRLGRLRWGLVVRPRVASTHPRSPWFVTFTLSRCLSAIYYLDLHATSVSEFKAATMSLNPLRLGVGA